jgi:iron complex outermembrane receptor protein
MFTELRNPTIQNYGRSSEPHFGGRTDFKFTRPATRSVFHLDIGAELQQGFTSLTIHKNRSGNQDTLRSYDEIINRQSLVFSQASLDLDNWTIAAGASLNFLKINFQRFVPASLGKQQRQFNNEVAPRLAVMKKFKNWNIYSSIAKGFSPPTTAELLPTGGFINLDLNAEEGINYDLGAKGYLPFGLTFDMNAFIFSLENTIVQRRTSGGGDYFINAGKTKQHGIETALSYPLFQSSKAIERSSLWLAHTWHQFAYKSFKQLNNDFSGNALPGVAPHVISAGYDLLAKNGLLGSFSYYYSDRIPLNDANADYADAYHLLGLKIGYQKWIHDQWRLKIMAGVDNLLDEEYSLGNDINGFGGRYYNAAAARNYYAAIIIEWKYR